MNRNSEGRPASIRNTIVALVTCSTVVLLAGFAFFLYKVFENNQRREHSRFLMSKLHYIRSEIQSVEPEDSELEELHEVRDGIEHENATRRSGELFVDVLTADGKTLMRVAGAEEFYAAAPPFPSAAASVGNAKFRYWEAPGGEHFVLTSLASGAAPNVRIVRVALDWSAEEDLIEDFNRKSFGALVLGAFLAALLAATIARRALRPIEQITEAVRAMDVTTLDQPLEAARWPAELAGLGAAFAGMQLRLSASFQRLSQFSADLAHELRTPINNAMGEAEVALRQERTPEVYRDVIASLHEELGRLARMSEGLLFLARSERGAGSLQRTDFAAREEALVVADYYRLSAEEKDIRLFVNGNAPMRADREMFRRALSNLLANAIHYTPRGGAVTVGLIQTARAVEVRVSDSGDGIALENRSKIFDRFFRADEARSSHPDGSGLGLSIVRSIVELHGGSVSVESEPGAGATFILTFPAGTHITEM